MERKLRKGVLQIRVQLFPGRFLPIVPEVLNIYLFGVIFFIFIGFQIELSCLLRLETYFSKDSSHISWSFDLSLLLVWLYFLLLSGVRVLCQIDLALLFSLFLIS